MSLDLTGQAMDNVLLSKVEAAIGTYRDSDLDIATFNQVNLGTWMLCDGQDCSTTEYFTLTGKVNVPNFVDQGTFRRQAKAGRALGSYEGCAVQSHNHRQRVTTAAGGNLQHGSAAYNGNTVFSGGNENSTEYTGDVETRPYNHACNVFIKVSHT